MNLFEEIEGLSGEMLTSGLLRLLILRSQRIRDEFVSLISSHSPIGPITSSSHFSCYTEHPTFEEESGSGRIDIVLELDDAVVGIENKLFADFQEGQPEKYLKSISEIASTLTTIRHREIRWFFVILIPRTRHSEVVKFVKGKAENITIISWEDLIPVLEKWKHELDPTSKVIVCEFFDFVRFRISFIPNFPQWVPHLRRTFEPKGTDLQRELVGRLWDFFPNGGAKLSYGDTWVGYYFSPDHPGMKGWYGFVPASEVQGNDIRPAELIVVTSYPVNVTSPSIKAVTLVTSNFIGTGSNQYAWIIDFDKEWSSPETWSKELKAFNLRS